MPFAVAFVIPLGSFLLLNKASTTPQPKSSELIIITNKLTELLDNVELRTKLGKRGKEMAESQYSWENKIIEYLEAAK